MDASRRLVGLGAVALAAGGCSFSSTANDWNGRVGPNGRPVYVKSHTNVGLNLAIVLPFLGDTTLSEQIELITKEISAEEGDRIRMVESSSENYWHGFPPLTWVVTPVITSVSAEYEPSNEVLDRDRAEREKEEAEGP